MCHPRPLFRLITSSQTNISHDGLKACIARSLVTTTHVHLQVSSDLFNIFNAIIWIKWTTDCCFKPELFRRNLSSFPLPLPVLEQGQVLLEQGSCCVNLQACEAGVEPLSQLDLFLAELFFAAKLLGYKQDVGSGVSLLPGWSVILNQVEMRWFLPISCTLII